MTHRPLINAAGAFFYIALVAHFLQYGQTWLAPHTPEVVMGIIFLSLLVFSVAFMAATFFGTPLYLALIGEPKKGLSLFVRTLGIFAALVALFVVLVFLF